MASGRAVRPRMNYTLKRTGTTRSDVMRTLVSYAAAGAALAGVDGTEPEVPAAAASMDTLSCSDPAPHNGNNLSPASSALLLAAPTAPLAAAPADVAAAAACTNAYLHKSGQHRLSLKKKKRKHSLGCPKGAGTEKTSLSPHSAAAETDTPSQGR
ncbi:hypothetical protein Taro_007712 [Colocasia esculenta]|uniref:Uncharacterized protein n=1 Tax=Colocasia esculenta TaxID=4460 RepID=A0A843TUZ4_COLES|nr:hypothetical protein [Colocasia esculenta]